LVVNIIIKLDLFHGFMTLIQNLEIQYRLFVRITAITAPIIIRKAATDIPIGIP
jgi:hypothetical protein